MTKEQYHEWEKYVRLMEHVWNTSYHSILKCSPFEAAHGLPARSTLDTLTENDSDRPTDLMTRDGISAMRETARAFEIQLFNVRTEAAARNALLKKGQFTRSFKVGDEVSFYLPPSEKQAEQMGRKPKHLLQYKGPALIVRKLSDTTFQLDFEGRTYFRCFSEIRPYKSTKLPLNLPMATDAKMQERRIIVGNYVALCDTDDPNDDLFHLCEVTGIEDDKAILLNYATWGRNLKSARFSIMYQEHDTLRYTTEKPSRNAREQEVVDRVDLDKADAYIDHYDIRLTRNMKISAKSARQLRKLGLRHHILGQTFP